MSKEVKVPRRIAAVILNSLKGGVVPRIGLPYITVGREVEIQALLHDLDLIADGGASFRFLVGRYGSGKSFLIQTIRTHSMGENFVVADADLSPERRLQGGQGQGLSTYRELIRNLSTKTRPEGGALALVLDRWVINIQRKAAEECGSSSGTVYDQAFHSVLEAFLEPLCELVHGYDFSAVLKIYAFAFAEEDMEAKACVVMIDELVNLYKIPNSVTRQNNYEKILTMYNDTLQGKAHHLGIIMGGTPQSIEDRRRGVYSYEALRSRLTQGRFASEGFSDMLAPVIRLNPLTYEELLVLIEKLADIHAGYFEYQRSLTEDDLVSFLQIEFGRVGSDSHLTPREVIRDFIELLDIVYQNPDASVSSLLGSRDFSFAKPALQEQEVAPLYAEFKI